LVQINFGSKAVSCKIVYYGPGLCGKTTNVQQVHRETPVDRRSELTSINTDGDRTLFFDFMSLDLGKVAGMDTRFQLYTVPGQVYYNATRKLVLQGVDGIVFVADSSPDRMGANLDSWKNLFDNLAEYGLHECDIPVVIQYNKRDLANALSVDEMNRAINTIGAPTFEAIACRGEGVLATLKCVCGLVIRTLATRQQKPAGAMKPVPLSGPAPVAEPEKAVVATGGHKAIGEVTLVSRRQKVARQNAEAAASVSTSVEASVEAPVETAPEPRLEPKPAERVGVPAPTTKIGPPPNAASAAASRAVAGRAFARKPDSKRWVIVAAAGVGAAAVAGAAMYFLTL